MDPIFAEGQDALAHVEEFIYAYYRFGRAGSALPAGLDDLTRHIASRTRAAGVQVIANLTAYHGIWKQAIDVMPLLRGRWLDRDALDARLDAVAAYASTSSPSR